MPHHPWASARVGDEPHPGCCHRSRLAHSAGERSAARRLVVDLGRGLDAEARRHDFRDLDLGKGGRPIELLQRLFDVPAGQSYEPLEMDDRAVGLGQALLEVDVGGFLEDAVDIVGVFEADADLRQLRERVGLGNSRLVIGVDEGLEHALGLGIGALELTHPDQRDSLPLESHLLPAEIDLRECSEDRECVQVATFLQVAAGDAEQCHASGFLLLCVHLHLSLRPNMTMNDGVWPLRNLLS
jgi:hypothetical protein